MMNKYFSYFEQLFTSINLGSTVYICGCVKNCAFHLDNVFENIIKIADIFKDYQIIIAYDESTDETFTILEKYQKKLNMKIIINSNNTQYTVQNICNARNSVINYIREHENQFDYFIMLDMDDVCSKPIDINVLKKCIKQNKNWDALSFNQKEYYDIWALSIDNYILSCWHFENQEKNNVVDKMKNYITNKLTNTNELVSCISAFNGFGIYKTHKFINCNYDTSMEKNLEYISKKQQTDNENALGTRFNKDCWVCKFDCEHRGFHLEAIYKNNVSIKISPEFLFLEKEKNEMHENYIGMFEHPKKVCMTYIDHFCFSYKLSVLFFEASVKAFIHAILPDVYITSSSEINNKIHVLIEKSGCKKDI